MHDFLELLVISGLNFPINLYYKKLYETLGVHTLKCNHRSNMGYYHKYKTKDVKKIYGLNIMNLAITPEVSMFQNLLSLAFTYSDIDENDFVSLELPCLTSFTCYKTNFTKIPENILKLKINQLNFTNNKLLYLPKKIGEMKTLTKLLVGSNMLTELPKSFGKLDLKELNISYNRFLETPKCIKNMSIPFLYV